ncbi:MAG: hypothetical protein GY752_02110 [bacterium]|nr:hypothetical protein [bacterium]MCP4801018.1 hypothetical protein [bacterium]
MKRLAIVLALVLASSVASGAILYQQGFEDQSWLGGQYIDLGDPLVDHDLVNNPTEAFVDVPGVDAQYFNTRDGAGIADGDYVGVTDYAGTVGAWAEGLQGYQMSDCDGMMTIFFDDFPTAAAVSMDIFIQETGWEADDVIIIMFGGTTILDTTGQDIDDLLIEGMWIDFTVPVAGGVLSISLDCNSGSEALFIDDVVIYDDLAVTNENTSFGAVKALYR